MTEENKNKKQVKRVRKSIRSQIIATALCPLLAMSTSVSILSVNDFNPMLIANVIAAILLVGTAQLLFVAHSIVKPVRKVEECLMRLAEGELDIVIDGKMVKRKDEIGSMFEAMTAVSHKLKKSISDIQQVSEELMQSEEILDRVVEEAGTATGRIESAVQKITAGASKQYEDINETSGHVNEISGMISNIAGNVQHLEETSDRMKKEGIQSLEIMGGLGESNQRTNHAIERINQQVNLTYNASMQINAVIQMIAGIAKQTGLLALNAGIEAARAGEHGKGFSVVAEEISKLADQSSESAKEIDGIIGNLSTESGKMLEIMNEVIKDVEKQKVKLDETQSHFAKVKEGIEDSILEILEIGEQTQICNIVKDKITKRIEALQAISGESVDSTSYTQKSATELNQNMKEISSTAALLQEYAKTLDNQVRYFH